MQASSVGHYSLNARLTPFSTTHKIKVFSAQVSSNAFFSGEPTSQVSATPEAIAYKKSKICRTLNAEQSCFVLPVFVPNKLRVRERNVVEWLQCHESYDCRVGVYKVKPFLITDAAIPSQVCLLEFLQKSSFSNIFAVM